MRSLPLLLALCAAPAFADEARDVWMDKCKGCHGEDGRARTKAGAKEKIADFTSPEWQRKHSDSDLRTVIEEGSKKKPKMKPYKDKLSPEQIDALVFLIRDLKATN